MAMELLYTEDRWHCPDCLQLNKPDAYPKCSWCTFFYTSSPTGRLMERDRTPKSWEADAPRTNRRPEIPGCVSPRG